MTLTEQAQTMLERDPALVEDAENHSGETIAGFRLNYLLGVPRRDAEIAVQTALAQLRNF